MSTEGIHVEESRSLSMALRYLFTEACLFAHTLVSSLLTLLNEVLLLVLETLFAQTSDLLGRCNDDCIHTNPLRVRHASKYDPAR